MAENNFVALLKSFFANVLKYKALLKGKFKCVCVTMRSLVISLFSRDYIKVSAITRAQCSPSAWFLDGRTSILVLHIVN